MGLAESALAESLINRPIRSLTQEKTVKNFQERNITVIERGTPPQNGLVALTHPTLEDSRITRIALPGSYALVTTEALQWTRFERLNRLRAVIVSAMIPVYRDSSEMRQITYKMAAEKLNQGIPVTIAPTGRTTFTNDLPQPSELEIFGIMRIAQTARSHNDFITPAVRYVPEENITSEGQIRSSSAVFMLYGDPISLPASFFLGEPLSAEEEQTFKQQIVDAWTATVAQWQHLLP